MASLAFARPLEPDDLDTLEAIDKVYATRCELEPLLSAASVSFYTRSGHAFVATSGGHTTGFVLAHAVWDGNRPAVQVNRLAVKNPEDAASRQALLEAVTKSAYDAAVYDIRIHHPKADHAAATDLEAKDYRLLPTELYGRTLGSRGRPGGEHD